MALTNQTPVTVTTAADQKVLTSANRGTIIFQNRDASVEIFLGGAGLTAANGIALSPGATLIISQGEGDSLVDEAWFARTASGTAELRIATA